MALQQLIAIILGVTNKRAEKIAINLELASSNMKCVANPVLNLKKLSWKELVAAGLTEKQADKLYAALELGRLAYSQTILESTVVDDPDIASGFFMPFLGWKDREHAAVLVLSEKSKWIATEVLSIGTSTECIFNPSELFKTILKHGGKRAIIAHNHPSGEIDPSTEDIELTKIMIDAGKVMSIPIVDHLIIGNGTHRSLRQTTMLWDKYRKGQNAA